MVRYVQLDKKLVKQLKRLHKAGRNSRLAAEHAENIIRQWLSGEVKSPKQLTRGTRYGEARIKNCIKYDLVHAYRLLALSVMVLRLLGAMDDPASGGTGKNCSCGQLSGKDRSWRLGGDFGRSAFCAHQIRRPKSIDPLLLDIPADVQTSGGLIISLPEDRAPALLNDLKAGGVPDAAIIGRATVSDRWLMELL